MLSHVESTLLQVDELIHYEVYQEYSPADIRVIQCSQQTIEYHYLIKVDV